MHQHAPRAGVGEEVGRARLCLAAPLALAAEDDPVDRAARMLAEEPQHGAAAADLDVVRVRAEAEDAERPLGQREAEHQSTRASGIGTTNLPPQSRM